MATQAVTTQLGEASRVLTHAAHVRQIIEAGGKDGAVDTPEKLAAFDETMALTFEEHFAYQTAQARAHASGKLPRVEAEVVYQALNGEAMNDQNGGWAPHVDTALKVTITQLMGELILR